MQGLLKIENYPDSEALIRAASEQFSTGVEMVNIASGRELVGAMFSPDAVKKALTRNIAEQWVNHPEMLDQLTASLNEEAEDWEE